MSVQTTIDSVVISRQRLQVILSMAIEKRKQDEVNLPQETTLLKEMMDSLNKVRMGKHIVIV